MLSKYFQEHFEIMPKPEELSADEARQLVIDAYRLLVSRRLAVGGVAVQVEDPVGDDLGALLRLAEYLSAYTAISASLPPDADISLSTISSANFVAAQIFEFLAEYSVIGQESLVAEQESNGAEQQPFSGFEFWTEEGYLWISAIAHYLLARHDGNATTLSRRFREMPKSANGSDLSSWSVGFDLGYRLASLVVDIIINFLGCDFAQVLQSAEARDAVFEDIQASSDDFELVDLALTSVLFDIAEACVEMSRALTILAESDSRTAGPWLDTLTHVQETVDLLGDSALKWIIDVLRRVMNDFAERGLLFIEFPDPSPTSGKWHKYLEHRAKAHRALLWPAHLEAISKGSINPQTSMVISMPTGSGKSFIAETRIAASLENANNAWVLYIVPTNALVRQVTRDLRRAFEPLGAIVRGFVTDREYTYLSQESLSPDELPAEPVNYVAVMTPEKLRMAISLWPEAFETCVLCVVDEAHLIGEPNRGSLLDLALAQLRVTNAETPFLLMSAMMSNPDDLAQWLRGIDFLDERHLTRQALMLGIPGDVAAAEQVKKRERLGDLLFTSVYRSDWEPSSDNIKWTILDSACVFKQEKDRDTDEWGLYKFKPMDTAKNCVEGLVKAGLKTILFRPDLWVESSARELTDRLGLVGPDDPILDVWERVLGRELGTDKVEIIKFLRQGTCYHKGPMLTLEQILAERYFATDDRVRLMVCTSTLTYGLNLPVEALVFAGSKRYDAEIERPVDISSKDFLNIAGRTGRPAFANQGLVQVLPNWLPLEWDSLLNQYKKLQKLYLAPSEEDLKVIGALTRVLDQIGAGAAIDPVPSDEVSAVVTTWFGRPGDERLLRHTFAFFLKAQELQEAEDEETEDEDAETPDQYAHRITTTVAHWIRRQEEAFPLTPITQEAFRRSGLPSRTCRHLYVEAGRILEDFSPLNDDSSSDEESFQYWLDRVVGSVQAPDCDFFFQPRVKVGDKAVRENWYTVWEYESEALQLWISGALREELITSRFARGDNEYWARHRATMFVNRTTQQYAFALGSLLFFLECRWREEDAYRRPWSIKAKELGLDWKPHLAHLPLAVKWGVRSISALAWVLAGVRFRFAANTLGEIYPSADLNYDLERQLERVRQLARTYQKNYRDQRPELTVNALRIQSEARVLDYEIQFLQDVADALCRDELH